MAVGLRGSLSSPGTSASPHVSPGSCDEAGPLEVVILEILSSLPYCTTDGVETGLDGIQNQLSPPSLGQTLWERLNLLSATNNELIKSSESN